MPPPREPEKFRTAAFHIPRDADVREIRFWTLEESSSHGGHYVREHIHYEEMFGDGAESRPITEMMPERDALARMLQIEAEYPRRYDRVDDKDPRWKRLLGAEYFDAAPAGEFPALTAERNREKLKLLRSRHPNSRLKPGK